MKSKLLKNLILIVLLIFHTISYSQKTPIKINEDYHNHLIILKDTSEIKTYLNNLIKYHLKKGYLSFSIDSIKQNKDTITSYIYKGNQFILKKIQLNINNTPFYNKNFKLHEIENSPLNINHLNEKLLSILSYYENNGFPFALISIDSIYFIKSEKNDTYNAYIKINIDKGNIYHFNNIYIKGDNIIKPYYIQNYLQIYEGTIFCQKKLNRISSLLNNITFLKEIKPYEIIFDTANTDIFLYIKKQKANNIDGLLGIIPSTDNSNKMTLIGEIKLNIQNTFYRGEIINFEWIKPENYSQQLNFNFFYPFVFRSMFSINTSLNILKKDTSYINVKQKLFTYYNISPVTRLFINIEKFNSNYIRNTELYQTSYSDIKSNIYGIGINSKLFDYPANPSKGYNVTININLNDKQKTKPYNFPENIKYNPTQYSFNLNSSIFYPIYKNNIFHNTINIYANFGEYLFSNEMQLIGGFNSLRGFEENSIIASSFIISSYEYKYILDKNSAFILFLNHCLYKNSQTKKTDHPLGFGLGISLGTKVGLLNIFYALGKQMKNPILMRNAKIHIGISSYI